MVRCSLTGGRGIHIRLSAKLFGGFEPSKNVPMVIKAIATHLAQEAGITIDLNIYDRNRLLRVPNSHHRSGRYCVPVYAGELLNKEIEELVALMERPRHDVAWVGDVGSVESLVDLKKECQCRIGTGTPKPTRFPDPPPGRAEEIVAFLDRHHISYESKGKDYVIRCPAGAHEDNHPSLGIERESGVFHCFGCGASGKWEDFRRLIERRSAIEGEREEYRSVADGVCQIRQKQGSQDRRKDFEINAKVIARILSHMSQKGNFYQDGYKAYYFLDTEKRLLGIDPDDDGFRLLLHRYGINPADSVYRWTSEGLKNEALADGKRTEVHRLSCYDPQKFTLYLSNNGDGIYRISPDAIDLVDNGADGVLFLSDRRDRPFTMVDIFSANSLFTQIVTSKINFADDVLTPKERQKVFELWFYSMFFGAVMPTKPITAFIGPKGSGKSITLRKVGILLFGQEFDVTPLTNDSKDFDAAVTNSSFVAFDNADHKCVWLNDRLATVATGGVIKKRKLYTTNKLVEIPARCFIGVTAHTPHFRRDDVADRLLIMKVDRFKEFVSEKTLLTEVLANRNAIMTEVIHRLQEIVRALKKYCHVDDSSTFRMADFADFAMKVARHEEWEEELKMIFDKASHEQSEFTLEADPIFETLTIWAKENPDKEVTYKELWGKLQEVAESEGIDFKEYEKNSRRFVRRMPNIRSNLEEFFEIRDIPKGSRKVHHMFRLKDSE